MLTDKNYKSGSLPLVFKHQLAKVRVKVVKGTYTGNLSVTAVSVNGYTSCTVNNGSVSPSGSLNSIQMHQNGDYWEANLVPGTGALGNVITINADGKSTTCTLASAVDLTAVQMYTYEVTVNKAGPTVIKGGETITEPGDYIMTGNITQTVTLNGDNINLTLKDANVSISSGKYPAIDIKGGSTVINVEGTSNELSSFEWGGITMSNNANLTIKGNGKDLSSLKVTAGYNGWDGATTVGIGAGRGNTCGDITIQNVTLTVTGNDAYVTGAAAIGTSGESDTKCGNIIITKAIVNATSGAGAAAIGTGGSSYTNTSIKMICGDIRITESDITITLNSYLNTIVYGAGIGTGALRTYQTQCGKIILDALNEQELTTFTSNWKLNGTGTANYKIGEGGVKYGTTVTFGGIYLNGQEEIKSYADGWGSW